MFLYDFLSLQALSSDNVSLHTDTQNTKGGQEGFLPSQPSFLPWQLSFVYYFVFVDEYTDTHYK